MSGPRTKLQHKKDIMQAVVDEFMREADKVQRGDYFLVEEIAELREALERTQESRDNARQNVQCYQECEAKIAEENRQLRGDLEQAERDRDFYRRRLVSSDNRCRAEIAGAAERKNALPRVIKPGELRKGQEVVVIPGDYHQRINAFRGVVLGFSKDSYTDDGAIEMTGLERGIYSKDCTIVLHKEAE